MEKSALVQQLVTRIGGSFSATLRIDLHSRYSEEIFKWFLAAVLFGARISESIVNKSVTEFFQSGVCTSEKIRQAGWDRLVEILDRGGYVRYDFKTADKLLELAANLHHAYNDDLNLLHQTASDSRDLELRLKNLAKGIGDVTVNIFLRELRGIWQKANPELSGLAFTAARNLRLLDPETRGRRQPLEQLESYWAMSPPPEFPFTELEAALVRLGKDYCRKNRCQVCPMRADCVMVNRRRKPRKL